MQRMTIVGLAAVFGVLVGNQLPRSGSAGYVVITGVIKDTEAANEYLQKIRPYLEDKCEAKGLVLDRNTDIREGKRRAHRDPFTMVVRFSSKQAAIACYEDAEYQQLKLIGKPYLEWNFRITEGRV